MCYVLCDNRVGFDNKVYVNKPKCGLLYHISNDIY